MCVYEVQLQVMFLVKRQLTHPANKLDDVFSVLHVLIELRFLPEALAAYRTSMHAVHVHTESSFFYSRCMPKKTTFGTKFVVQKNKPVISG